MKFWVATRFMVGMAGEGVEKVSDPVQSCHSGRQDAALYGSQGIYSRKPTLTIVPFDLSDAIEMSAAGKLGDEPGADDLQCQFWRDCALAQREDIRVGVLARPTGGVQVPTKRAADAFDFVGDDGFAVAGTTEHDAALELT